MICPTNHHIIPCSRKEEWFHTDKEDNIIRLKRFIHEDFHKLFHNTTPQEQLEILLKINEKVLSPMTKSLIKILVEVEEKKFYKSNLLIKWKLI